MADTIDTDQDSIRARDEQRARDEETSRAAGADTQTRQGGINQGQLDDAAPQDGEASARRSALGDLVDDNAASHQGGAGAQGGQADYGSAGNLAGIGAAQAPIEGSNPR